MSQKLNPLAGNPKNPAKLVNPGKNWHIYILRCADDSLYTGITTDLNRRVNEHNSGTASKYTRCRLPAKLIWSEGSHTESSAKKREIEIKKLPRGQKLSLLKNTNPRQYK
ncbi:GIY-YIG nuclease family protein [Candidatus Uhrbacteria bacterium]|nr:GIY-YIG nuclease family protein [Candidatus Uhrbacteria bacterium]